MKKCQISGDDNYVDIKWSQILRQQLDRWLKLVAVIEYKSKQTFSAPFLTKENIFFL